MSRRRRYAPIRGSSHNRPYPNRPLYGEGTPTQTLILSFYSPIILSVIPSSRRSYVWVPSSPPQPWPSPWLCSLPPPSPCSWPTHCLCPWTYSWKRPSPTVWQHSSSSPWPSWQQVWRQVCGTTPQGRLYRADLRRSSLARGIRAHGTEDHPRNTRSPIRCRPSVSRRGSPQGSPRPKRDTARRRWRNSS